MIGSLKKQALHSFAADHLFTSDNIFSNSSFLNSKYQAKTRPGSLHQVEMDTGIDCKMFVNLLSTVHLA